MYSQYLPSSRIQDLTVQFKNTEQMLDVLPTRVSDIGDVLEGCILVDLDDPNANVVSVGLDSSGHKVIAEIDKQVDDVYTQLGCLKQDLSEQLASVFKQYVQVKASGWVEPSPEDPQEQFEAFIAQDLNSLSVYDWKDTVEAIAPSTILSEVFTRWTPDLARSLDWWPTVEKTMATPHAVCQAVLENFRRGNEIDPAWREYVIKDIKRGFESEKRLSEMAGECALTHAINAPGSGFMGWGHKQWYKHITSLDISPKFSASGVANLLRAPARIESSTPDATQKTIMARFRRLLFIDPEVAKHTFGVFASGDRKVKAFPVVTASQGENMKSLYDMAAKTFLSNHKVSSSLGQSLANTFMGLDLALEKIGQAPQRSYAEMFHELRSELQIGSEVAARLEKDSTPSTPKM